VDTEGKVVWEGHPRSLKEEQIKAVLSPASRPEASRADRSPVAGHDQGRARTSEVAKTSEETQPKREAVSPDQREIARLFSLGKSWLANKNAEKARECFQVLVDRFPDSSEAASAREYLEQLK
jgi:hypothetical protein